MSRITFDDLYNQLTYENIEFTEDDFTFPFLYDHLQYIANLKFFVLDSNTNTYRLKLIILEGKIVQAPFCMKDLKQLRPEMILYSNTQTSIVADTKNIFNEYIEAVTAIETILCSVQTMMRNNGLTIKEIMECMEDTGKTIY